MFNLWPTSVAQPEQLPNDGSDVVRLITLQHHVFDSLKVTKENEMMELPSHRHLN